MFLTEDRELRKSRDYNTVMSIVEGLWNNEVIQRSKGYCYSTSDMVKTLLEHEGINSRIVECTLTVLGVDPVNMQFLGYEQTTNNREVPTHVVVVTETEIPMIIDLSIGHLRKEVPYIVERANGALEKIAEIKYEKSTWVYKMRDQQLFPKYHQESIVNRMALDKQVNRQLYYLKIGLWVALVVGVLNFSRGLYDLYQTHFDPNTSREVIAERINTLEEINRRQSERQKQLLEGYNK